MSNILIINAHHAYPFSPGKLNAHFAQVAHDTLSAKGHTVRIITVSEGIDVAAELANHQWADDIILQSPVNWMGVPWPFKRLPEPKLMGACMRGFGRLRGLSGRSPSRKSPVKRGSISPRSNR